MVAPDTKITRPAIVLPNDVAFDPIASEAQTAFGFLQFTVFVYIPDGGALCRIWTDDQINYPNGGEKTMPRTAPYVLTVLEQQRPMCSWTPEDIRETYNDYASILDKGVGSLISVPVVSAGETVGTLNFSGRQYGNEVLPRVLDLAKRAAPLFHKYRA